MVLKVKEPLAGEVAMLRPGQVLFTYLHLASSRELFEGLRKSDVIGIGYETVQTTSGHLPLLTPMSEIAGRLAVQEGAYHLRAYGGGRGVLLGGVPGVPPADVVILGGGIVGINATKVAMGFGAHVTIIDVNHERLRYLDDIMHGNVITVYSTPFSIERATRYADLLIGGVLIPGARAPRLVTREMIKGMKKGSVVVDVSVDQGGCIETVEPTTHASPVRIIDGVLHYGVTNMPAAVPRTATHALTNATLPYVLAIANLGVEQAVKADPALARGVNLWRGKVVHEGVAEAFGIKPTPLN
jgi:alanine dehydrogenase